MKVLAISTSQSKVGVAFSDGERFLMQEFAPANTGEVLRSHITPYLTAGFDLIAVDIGPGSYTGTRVGVAFGQGLAAARNLPWVGISAWDILQAIAPEGSVVVASSRSGEVLIKQSNGEVVAVPLGTVTQSVFGYPMLDPVKFGGSESQVGTVPNLSAYLTAMVTLALKANAHEALPVYYDRFSSKEPAQ